MLAMTAKENLPVQTPTPTRTTTGQGVRPPGTYDYEEGGPRQDTQRRSEAGVDKKQGNKCVATVRTTNKRWTEGGG